MSLTLVVPDRPALEPSGGDRYDAAVVAQWRRLGRDVEVVAAAGGWPWPTPDEVARLVERVATPSAGPALLDGLVACAAPEAVERCAAVRPTAVLVHSLLADGAGATGGQVAELDRRERRALRATHGVIAVSDWAREQLASRHGVQGAAVALPGTGPAAVAPGSLGSGIPVLLSLGAVTPLKNHALLLAALQEVADLTWRLVVAGPAPDQGHLDALKEEAAARGIAGRVDWAGPLVGDRLEETWARADLLVHPSRSETYGMAVAEALAHGIPAVVGAGTGAVEALTGPLPGGAGAVGARAELAGTTVPTDDPAPLARALRRWLTEPALRREWRRVALVRRNLLAGWGRTVEHIDRELDRISS